MTESHMGAGSKVEGAQQRGLAMTSSPQRLARLFRTEQPHGPLRFVAILTTDDDRPLAHGEVTPGSWEFINGQAGFVASGQLTPVDSGKPRRCWTFTVDLNGNVALLTWCPVNIEKIRIGDTVHFDNTITLPLSPLPDWLVRQT